jgi:outer membrane protein assembly factor BamB
MAKGKRKILVILLVIFIGIPAGWIIFSLVGRQSPTSIAPPSWVFRAGIHNPARFLVRLSEHESLPQLLSAPALAPVLPIFKAVQEKAYLKNPLVRAALRGSIEIFMLEGTAGFSGNASPEAGPVLAAWDSGFLSPLLRFLPSFSKFAAIPGLYYVQAGKLSRFEYRAGEGNIFYIGPRRNLLVICNDQTLFEALINGRETELFNAGAAGNFFRPAGRSLNPADFDAALLFSPHYLGRVLAGQDQNIAAVLQELELSGVMEAGISIYPARLELQLTGQALSRNPALSRLLDRRSQIPNLAESLPAGTQYSTILSAGSLSELYDAAAVFSGPLLDETLKRADSSSRLFLGLSLDDLLFSWSGTEFAVFGMEGRPHPVYAVQIADERKRQEVFSKAFRSIVLNEIVQLNLDGVRIPQIEVPEFLQTLLRRWNIQIPSPYYTVHNGFLLASESAEALLSAVRAMQKNDVLPKTQTWRDLAGAQAETSAFFVHYSLDRSLPFFLRGNTALSEILGVYRRGLARIAFDRNTIRLSLAAIPGSGSGLALMSGYPLSVGENPASHVYGVLAGKPAENRIILARGGTAIAVNPVDNRVYELEGPKQDHIWVIPAEGLAIKSSSDPSAWVVSAQGRVTLVNGNMEIVRGFPLSTGVRLSSPPAAYNGRLFLSGEDGRVIALDSTGKTTPWAAVFTAALRSPPSFLPTQSGRYAAVYPKSFFGEIWLLDLEGRALPGWPAPVSGIAFGSPLLFSHNNRVLAAFITQAGELSVFDESGSALPPFPVEIDNVFYLQPVFDGEYLWLVSGDGTLFQVSLGGEVLYQRIPNFTVREEGFITVFDVSGGKAPAIFVSGDGNAFYGYSGNFRSLEGFPLPVWGRPFFGDLNGNGKIECVGVGMDNQLYRWQFR